MADVMERPNIALHGIRTVTGRYAIGEGEAYPGINVFACRLRMISSDTFRVSAPVIPAPGERVEAALGPFGSISGHVERQFEDGFVVGIDQDATGRDRLNESITDFTEQLWTGDADRRGAYRLLPRHPRTVFARPDGWSQPCLIMDYSASGVAVSSAFQPAVGEVVVVGQITGEVVRLFDVGFAVRFFEPHDLDGVEERLEAPAEWSAMVRGAFSEA